MPLYPLYRDVQLRYGDELQKEHRAKHAQVAALEAEARETSSTAALQASRRRVEGQEAVRQVEEAAERRVQELERERLRLLEAHHRELRDMQEEIEKERLAADQRLRDIEEETQVLYGQCEADIRRVNGERDAATSAARERCAAAERAGDEAARGAERYEREVLAQARKAQVDEETRHAWRVREAERRCETWRKHCEESVVEAQRRVAEHLEELLGEATRARESLADNRARADQHLEYDFDRKKEVTTEELARANATLVTSRRQLHEAEACADATAKRAAAECDARQKRHLRELHDVAGKVEAFMQSHGRLEALDKPVYIKRLEELAARLRSGRFSQEAEIKEAPGEVSNKPERN